VPDLRTITTNHTVQTAWIKYAIKLAPANPSAPQCTINHAANIMHIPHPVFITNPAHILPLAAKYCPTGVMTASKAAVTTDRHKVLYPETKDKP
jgi:hypothetical protein